jgi:hypothetical protein
MHRTKKSVAIDLLDVIYSKRAAFFGFSQFLLFQSP